MYIMLNPSACPPEHLHFLPGKGKIGKNSKLPYLTRFNSNKSNSTFKVDENKTPLFFRTDIIWGRYELFVFFPCERFSGTYMKWQNSHNSPGWTLIIKKCTFISSTFKVEENKVPFFLDQTWFEGDISFLYFFLLVKGFPVPSWNDRITITHKDEL